MENNTRDGDLLEEAFGILDHGLVVVQEEMEHVSYPSEYICEEFQYVLEAAL